MPQGRKASVVKSIHVTDERAYTRLQRARTSLLLAHPFFATLAMRLKLREDYSCQTAWTDGTVFGYNPHYINMLPSAKLEGLAAHIVMHPACGHHKRRGKREPLLWNKACDYVINSLLLDAGFLLPDGHLVDAAKSGRSAEAVYEILLAEEEAETAENGETEAEKEPGTEEMQEEEGGEEERSTKSNGETGEDDQGGSQGDPGMSGEVRDEDDGAGDSEQEGDPVDWDEAVIHAAIHARGIGELPAGLRRFLEDRLYPRLDWKRLLARFIKNAARSDYSWTLPNPRYLHQNIYFPSLKNCELEELAVAIDTSGSISQQEIDRFLGEVEAIISMNPSRVHLLGCDMQLQTVQVYERGEGTHRVSLSGGGGTDYRPVFEYLDKHRISPACLVYLTDLECLGYPDDTPEYPVLWARVGDTTRQPPFGDVLHID